MYFQYDILQKITPIITPARVMMHLDEDIDR